MTLDQLRIMIFADGASLSEMKEQAKLPYIKGFTTNPTLMRKAGVTDYAQFAQEAVQALPQAPLSFEVFSDEFELMEREALKLTSLASNVYVKIPITNSRGESSLPLVRSLSQRGVALNITAMLTLKQVEDAYDAIAQESKAFLSVFAGRIADTGRDPKPILRQTAQIAQGKAGVKSLWASCRELYNVIEADACDVDIITVPGDLLKKLPLLNKDLTELSLETVRMFVRDSQSLGFSIL